MNIKIKHIHIENFCGMKKFDADFKDLTEISGKNGTGKSTIKNAIYWVLFDKMADGTSPVGIRPHDANGVDKDNIDILVEITLDHDGKELRLKKFQKQKWTKHKGDTEKTFEGNFNTFEVNDIPKTQKVFKEYIEEKIMDIDTFFDCTNPVSFFGLNDKKRREKLLKLEETVTDEEVIKLHPEFNCIAKTLEDGTIDELIARSKKIIKTKNDRLEVIPELINELDNQKVDINFADLEVKRKSLVNQMGEIDKQEEDLESKVSERNSINEKIMKLQFSLSDLSRNANAENIKNHRAKEIQLDELKSQKEAVLDATKAIELKATNAEKQIARLEKMRQDALNRWKETKALKFDESSLTCPYCKQEYPTDKQEQIKAEFESRKENTLKEIVTNGNNLKVEIDRLKAEIDACNKEIEKGAAGATEFDPKIEELKKQIAELPEEINVFETQEYLEIQQEISDNEKKLELLEDPAQFKAELIKKRSELRNSIREVESELSKRSQNDNLDQRIKELETEQLDTSQMIANEHKTLALLESFNVAKMNLLSEKVNKNFSVLHFQLFRKLINGKIEECCMPLVNGTSYDGLLNTGNKILANIDICQAFQKKHDVQLPIMVDDSESLDSDKRPVLSTQMVYFKRDDCPLTVGD